MFEYFLLRYLEIRVCVLVLTFEQGLDCIPVLDDFPIFQAGPVHNVQEISWAAKIRELHMNPDEVTFSRNPFYI